MIKKIITGVVVIFAVIGFGLTAVYTAVELGWTKTEGVIDRQHDFFKDKLGGTAGSASSASVVDSMDKSAGSSLPIPSWSQTEEWQSLEEAVKKDAPAIRSAAARAGVSPRTLASILVVEQLRLFHSDRELFKSVFAPLKILAVQSQFSWGVMGIKQDTARQIEAHLKDQASPWYLGKDFEHILDFSNTVRDDQDTERFTRLTDDKDRGYSYLYAALLIRQIQSQWSAAGTPIHDRPEILATLFNIGFDRSRPHSNPLSGGAEIELSTGTYSFGRLAGEFFYSGILATELPY